MRDPPSIARAKTSDWRAAGLRRKLYVQLEPAAWPWRGLSPVNVVVFITIIITSILAIIETEPTIASGRESLFMVIEWIIGGVYSLEYAARAWTAAENPRFGPGGRGLLRYMRSPIAIIDLISILTSFATPAAGLQPYLLRAFRLARILRIAKLGRMSNAMSYLIEAVAARRYELLFSLFVSLTFMVFSASLLYLVEGPAQPDKFGSIPRAMWWATAALTTIGYGDVYPVTVMGRILAAATALGGIGLVAMPTGIMAAAFSEAVQKHSRDLIRTKNPLTLTRDLEEGEELDLSDGDGS
ncbi:MAG: ion transporter [Caulobacteraceae bacterium]